MACDATLDWIWEQRFPDEDPPRSVAVHLAGCAACRDELAARRATTERLRGLRSYWDDEPPEGVHEDVLSAVGAALRTQQTGRFDVGPELDELAAELPPEVAAELLTDLDRDLRTTGRLRLGDAEVDALRARAEWGCPRGWAPPRASIAWMVAASLLLMGSLGLGFLAGRGTAPSVPVVMEESLLAPRTRVHSVSMSTQAVRTLQEGNTYLLSGPVGGPYKVLGVVNWTDADFVAPMPPSDDSEIVVAVGPAGNWSRGKQLVVGDLVGPDVEILGRRAVAWH